MADLALLLWNFATGKLKRPLGPTLLLRTSKPSAHGVRGVLPKGQFSPPAVKAHSCFAHSVVPPGTTEKSCSDFVLLAFIGINFASHGGLKDFQQSLSSVSDLASSYDQKTGCVYIQ